MKQKTFDTNRSELFSNRLVDIFNGGAIALMISIGHRTKLFDVLETLEPSTSQEIADAAGLGEIEIKAMKKSAAVVWKGFEQIKRSLKVGITEKELALSFEIHLHTVGAIGLILQFQLQN